MKKTALKVVEQHQPDSKTFDKLYNARCKLAFMSEACYAVMSGEQVTGAALGCHLIMDDLGEELDSLLKSMDAEYEGMGE